MVVGPSLCRVVVIVSRRSSSVAVSSIGGFGVDSKLGNVSASRSVTPSA